jgi:hypothetical protein
LIREAPDLVAVWNDAQRREAIELHRVRAEIVVATGAHTYDHWFEWEPTGSREAFLSRIGLEGDRPVLLYLCSSPFIAPEETSFVKDWIVSVRSAGGRLADAAILIRPHPQNAAQWAHTDVEASPQVRVWPREGADPVDRSAKSDFYDSIYHCDAVVGVNTSALIETAIVGRTVFTILDARFSETQEGTLHFHHLADREEGLLTVARSFEEHVSQLHRFLEQEDGRPSAAGMRFLTHFVRPHGVETPSAPFLADAIEALALAEVPERLRHPNRVMRGLLTPVALTLQLRPRSTARRAALRARRYGQRASGLLTRRLRRAAAASPPADGSSVVATDRERDSAHAR